MLQAVLLAAALSPPDTLTPPGSLAPPPAFVERAVPSADDYSACRRAVEGGASVVLVVGGGSAPATDLPVYRTPSLTGFPPGAYSCFPLDGVPKMLPLTPSPSPSPAPLLPRVFNPPVIPYFPAQTLLGVG